MEETEETQKTDFTVLFENERMNWRIKIQETGTKLKSIYTVAEAQVELFSMRQILIEYSFKLADIVAKLGPKERKKRALKLKEYTEKSNVRYGINETKVLIEGDLSEITGKLEMVEGHRKFIDQTVQTVDHMLYGIRQRVALEEYLRGSTIK